MYISIIIIIIIILLFLTVIGLTPSGSNTIHIYTQTEYREQYIHNKQKKPGSVGHAPSLQVIPWHLPYNRGKCTEKPT
jgi:hypothetical protein